MEGIDKLIKSNSKFKKLVGPLKAAQICDTARDQADGRFTVISFRDGLLTLGAPNSAAANNLKFELENIKEQINQKIDQPWVERIWIKIIDG